MLAAAAPRVYSTAARSIAPRKPLTVSQWADAERKLSSKESPKPGTWHTDSNPPLREPMDCMSKDSGVREMVAILPIQFGKTNLELNILGYTMDHDPCPIMSVLPDDLTMSAWIAQKLNPMIEETPALQRALTSTASRDSSNQRAFKDFKGGQLFVEHAKTQSRMALRTVRRMIVDELDKMIAAFSTGEDPYTSMLGRLSAFPSTSQVAFVGSPGIKGISRLSTLLEHSDQRLYFVPCPHCGAEQPLTWAGLHWSPDATECWYACRANNCRIEERFKTRMIAQGAWVPQKPGIKRRGYQLNCLYYQIDMGPRWLDLVHMFRDAQNDPAKLQVFVQERLAEPWEDPAMRSVKQNVIADRAEPYKLRIAPYGVIEITVGVDTQDNRLEVHIIGWGRNLAAWTLDYVVLPGDPAEDNVWVMLTDLLNRPIEHASGAKIPIAAVAIDMGGHRSEAVKAFVRRAVVRRPMCIHGSTQNNAPVLGKAKLQDVTWRGRTDKRGVPIYAVGTVAIKHYLYARIGTDSDRKKVGDSLIPKEAADRFIHLSNELPPEYFAGLVGETYNPAKNRFEKRSGVRNEPLDTWVYAFAAAHHPDLRLHRRTKAEWDAAEMRLTGQVSPAPAAPSPIPAPQNIQVKNVPHETYAPSDVGTSEWSRRL